MSCVEKVSREEFWLKEYECYEKMILYYYVDDDTLVTEEDEIIVDVDTVVGNLLDEYDFKSNEEETIYIRNYSLETDYEVIKVCSSFADLCEDTDKTIIVPQEMSMSFNFKWNPSIDFAYFLSYGKLPTNNWRRIHGYRPRRKKR